MRSLYFATPVVSLYEGEEGTAVAPVTPVPGTSSDTPPAGTGVGTGDDPNAVVNVDPAARFDQDQVNKIVQDRLAKDRKKTEEKYLTLEASYQDLIANKALSDDGKVAAKKQLEDLRAQHRTTEEQAKHEKNQLKDMYESELHQYKEAAVHWESQHKEYLIERSLLEAAVANDAFMPTQIFDTLQKWTTLVDQLDENDKPTGKLTPMVDLPDVEADTGKPTVLQRTPMDAVERLKELQPNLFKANVVSGVGGNSNTGGITPGAGGHIGQEDQKELTTDQWMKQYKDDPTKLGLRARNRR